MTSKPTPIPPAGEIPSDTLTLDRRRRPSGARLDELRRELARADEEYQQAVREVRERYDSGYDPDRPVPPVTYAQIRELIPTDRRTALVQFTLTARRGVAIVITADRSQLIPFPDGWTARRVDELAAEWAEKCRQHRGDNHLDTWNRDLTELLAPLEEGILGPLAVVLRAENVKRVVLAPHRGLHVFPLHAARCLPDSTPFADLFDEVLYTPSLSILYRCARRLPTPGGDVLVIENPTADLPFAALEGRLLRGMYTEAQTLAGSAATREAILARAAGAAVLHYSGHTWFDEDDPLGSSLVLERPGGSPKRWVNLRDVFYQLRTPHNQLTVINGCESGRLQPDRIDEYLNFPTGFLFAGAPCVVNSLWSVDDMSSALLMGKFHELRRRDPARVAAALTAAQRWLRGLRVAEVASIAERSYRAAGWAEEPTLLRTWRHYRQRAATDPAERPFADPVHWAAAVTTGLGYIPPPIAPNH